MKTCVEWKLGFNQMYDNMTSHQAPGFSDFEISRLLTDAQTEIVLALCNGTLGESFESAENITDYLAPLVRQYRTSDPEDEDSPNYGSGSGEIIHIVEGSKVFALPSDFLFRTYEECLLSSVPGCSGKVTASVVPVTQDQYWRISRDPFKRPNNKKVFRLSYSSSAVEGSSLKETHYSELIAADGVSIDKYMLRYIKRPEPIIVSNLSSSGLSIDGKKDAKPCLLNEALHQTILRRAVEMAKAIWTA